MGIIFMCGESGCIAVTYDEEAERYANEERIKWASEIRRRTGKFPTMKEQEDFVEAAINRFQKVIKPNNVRF